MTALGDVRWLVVHTAAYDGEAGAETIYRWHTDPKPLTSGRFLYMGLVYENKADLPYEVRPDHRRGRGWLDIGYAWVVRRDGALEEGRPESHQGAHVAGINQHSIGICCEGHGDHEPHTPAQRRTLLDLLHDLMKRYTVPVEGCIGHREVNDLIDRGLVDDRWRTSKTCPGTMVDMDEIRAQLAEPHMP